MVSARSLVPPRLIPAAHEGDPELRQLTQGLARGDDEAWSRFNQAYGPGLFRQLLALTRGDHDLAQEAWQQAYLRIARHVRACEAEPMFKAWLRTVARTALLDCWRRRRRFTELLFRRWQQPPELAAPAEENRLMEELDRALGQLAPADRDLLEAKYLSGRDVRTLAAQLDLSPKAVESRLTRARAALRHEILAGLSRHE